MVRAGAYDYLTSPVSSDQLLCSLRRSLNETYPNTTRRSRRVANGQIFLQEVMGSSKKIRALDREVKRVAPTDYSVLIVGETGAGKEIVARALHTQSHRSSARFVAVDCGAIPETLIESELFGHEKGAFTGAGRTKTGKFEFALKGTLFLDEISNLPLALQSKLLRVLQERTFYRVGGNTPIKADIRVVAATNQDLVSSALPTTFRRDLYYRLAEYHIRVPSLRERKEDIIFLARRFIEITNAELRKNVRDISESARDLLMAYDWPGNVRELRSAIRKAVLLTEHTIDTQHLSLAGDSASEEPLANFLEFVSKGGASLKELVRRNRIAVEQEVLARVLEQVGGNKAEVARILHVDYKTIHTKLKEYGITANGRRK